jgi:hypothetical protein
VRVLDSQRKMCTRSDFSYLWSTTMQ